MAPPSDRGKRARKAGPRRPAEDPSPAAAEAEAPLVFPSDNDASEARPGRISLPASGLAADILALAGAAAIPTLDAARAISAPTPAAASLEASRAHNISFFSAPVREERKAAEATEHLATFFLGREEYGVDVRLV